MLKFCKIAAGTLIFFLAGCIGPKKEDFVRYQVDLFSASCDAVVDTLDDVKVTAIGYDVFKTDSVLCPEELYCACKFKYSGVETWDVAYTVTIPINEDGKLLIDESRENSEVIQNPYDFKYAFDSEQDFQNKMNKLKDNVRLTRIIKTFSAGFNTIGK